MRRSALLVALSMGGGQWVPTGLVPMNAEISPPRRTWQAVRTPDAALQLDAFVTRNPPPDKNVMRFAGENTQKYIFVIHINCL